MKYYLFVGCGRERKIKEPRCQDPKKEYKIKPRIKERIQKIKNLKGVRISETVEIFYLEFIWLFVFF